MIIPERLIASLKAGKVVLFLGSGANRHCKMVNNSLMPTADELSTLLSTKFSVRKASNLSETAELVEASATRKELNSYVTELMTGATPSEGFKLISSFIWNSIFTTNYDLLIEDIYKLPTAKKNLKVYYTSNQQIDIGPNDVPLYKLHGCISRSDTSEGRLVITPDDYADYQTYRYRLFIRLTDLLCDKPFLYIGYGRQDKDFRDIIALVQKEMNGDVPEGYALFPGKTHDDDLVWQRKGIYLIDADVDEFLTTIDSLIPVRESSISLKLKFPLPKQYDDINKSELDDLFTYFSLPVAEYGENSNVINFFKGSEANWTGLKNNIDAERDIYNEIMGELLEDAVSLDFHTTSYCILAEAGAGKSTLLRRLAYDLCHDFQQVVFWYRGERRINFNIVSSIFKDTGKRIFILIDRGSRFLGIVDSIKRDCIAAKIPLTLVIADRTNEWHFAGGSSFRYTKAWELSKLSDNEISKIIKKLDCFGCLGNLQDLTLEQRIQLFKDYSDRQLLIALRQATEGEDFDKLIIEEYESIPDTKARLAYLHICTMNAFGKGIRTSVLARSLNVNISAIGNIIQSLEGLIDCKDDIRTARHAIIARIVFFSLGEAARIDLIEQLIRKLDLGYISDNQIFRNLMTNDDLLENLGTVDTRRRLFEVLKSVDPSDPYIEQHEARMEIKAAPEGGSLERAEKLIKSALKKTNNAPAIRHTAGLLYKNRAILATGFEKRANLTKAITEFAELSKRSPLDDYSWVSLIECRVMLGSINETFEEKLAEYARAEADYQKALNSVGSTPYILRAKGKIEAALGHGDEAREFFLKAILGPAPSIGLFVNYINWELRHKGIKYARDASLRAIGLYNTDPEIQVLRSKSLILGDKWELSDVISLLIQAERASTGFTKLEAHYWHAVALWEKGRFNDAITEFINCKEIAITLGRSDTKNIRYISGMNEGKAKEYLGSVVNNGPRSAWFICNPGGVKVYLDPKKLLKDKQIIRAKIGFNRFGPTAITQEEEENYLFDSVV